MNCSVAPRWTGWPVNFRPNELSISGAMLLGFIDLAFFLFARAEGTQISAQGVGYPATPGIHSPAQVAGWKMVTDAVHSAEGLIFLQLWHCGRVSHSFFHDGALPVAPSPVAINGMTLQFRGDGGVRFETPRPLELDSFARLFLANPDLPSRFAGNLALNTPDPATFYGGDEKGYTDYPFVV